MSAERKPGRFGVLFVVLGLTNIAVSLLHHPVRVIGLVIGAGFLFRGIMKLRERRARA